MADFSSGLGGLLGGGAKYLSDTDARLRANIARQRAADELALGQGLNSVGESLDRFGSAFGSAYSGGQPVTTAPRSAATPSVVVPVPPPTTAAVVPPARGTVSDLGGHGVLLAESPVPGAPPVEPAEAPPHMRYTDRSGKWHEWTPGQKTSGGLGGASPDELVGLRARAMRTPDFPDLNHYEPSSDPRFAYTAPSPLFSLSQAGIAQDEEARGERAARYGGMRQEAIEEQQQNAQIDDPLGLEMKRKLLNLELERMHGAAAIERQYPDPRKAVALRQEADGQANANKLAALQEHLRSKGATSEEIDAAAKKFIVDTAMEGALRDGDYAKLAALLKEQGPV